MIFLLPLAHIDTLQSERLNKYGYKNGFPVMLNVMSLLSSVT